MSMNPEGVHEVLAASMAAESKLNSTEEKKVLCKAPPGEVLLPTVPLHLSNPATCKAQLRCPIAC